MKVCLLSDSMRALVLLACLAVSCLGQRPAPCESPKLLTGGLTVYTQNEKLLAFAKYSYDARKERIRLRESGQYDNKTFNLDVLLLFKEGVMYDINDKSRTCVKKKLCQSFHPLRIPENATLLGQVVLGSSSGPGQGVLVNTWLGQLKMKKRTAQCMSTVTEFGCIPVSNLFRTKRNGWMMTSFYNNVIGLVDPHELIPPHFCKDAKLEVGEPVTFYSLFETSFSEM